jgi:hypothetical protein
VIGEVVAEVTVHHSANFTLELSEDEAADLAATLGETYMDLGLRTSVTRIWQTLNSELINLNSRHIDGE